MKILQKLKPKHRLMASLEAAGWARKDIAKHLQCPLGTVEFAARSQVYRQAVLDENAKLRDRIIGSAVDRVMADGEVNVRFLQSVRDGVLVPPDGTPTDIDVMKLRLGASQTLFDRQVPKKIESSLDAHLNITIENHERDYLEQIERECIDITPDDPDPEPPEAA